MSPYCVLLKIYFYSCLNATQDVYWFRILFVASTEPANGVAYNLYIDGINSSPHFTFLYIETPKIIKAVDANGKKKRESSHL